MRGTAFLDVDGGVGFRTKEFLTETDPLFFSNNFYHIVKAWNFDTDNFDSMYDMFRGMRDLRLSQHAVKEFAKAIDFDLTRLRAGA